MPDDIDRIADELYELDPSEFVAARTAHAAAAKKSGDRALAKDIGALRKPTTVAWLVNILVREERDDTDALFALGKELRDAQRKSSASRMRELGARRQSLIRQLSRRAIELGAEHGREVPEDASREVGQTLHAALADPEIAGRVHAGRIVTAENYSGFGPASLSLAARLAEDPEPEQESVQADEPETESDEGEGEGEGEDNQSTQDDKSVQEDEDEELDGPDDAALGAAREAARHAAEEEAAREAARQEARESLSSATEDEASARADVDAAEQEKASATTRLADAKARLKQLREELHDAEAEELDARKAERASMKEAQVRRRAWEEAGARTAEAQRELGEID